MQSAPGVTPWLQGCRYVLSPWGLDIWGVMQLLTCFPKQHPTWGVGQLIALTAGHSPALRLPVTCRFPPQARATGTHQMSAFGVAHIVSQP